MGAILDMLCSTMPGAATLASVQHAPAGASEGAWWVMLIPGLPILAVLLVTGCAIVDIRGKIPAWITVGSLAAAFGVTLATYLEYSGGTAITYGFRWIDFAWGAGEGQRFVADFAFYVDSLTCLWMLFVTGLATLIALYASEYMEHDIGPNYCRFFAAFGLFVFSMACLVMGDNLVLLFLGWEGVGLCSYLLIGYFFKKDSAVQAAKKAFVMNRIGDLGLLIGIFLTFAQFGTVKYAELFELVGPYLELVREGRVGEVPVLVQIIPVLFMIGAFGKSAQLPLYVWLPDAMEGPTPVSALIHAATMVTAGVYLIARTYPLFLVSGWALPIVAWVGALTALLSATIGMAQFDIKRIMAYSTVSQLGYMFCGLAVLSSAGAAFHVFTHAFFKATLFLCCGAVMHGFAGQLDLRKLSGVMKMSGWGIVGGAMLVGCLNLAGVPGTAGYFSKDMILAESFVTPGPGYQAIGWILLITAGMTAYYTFRVFFRVFVGPEYFEPGDEHHGDDDHGHDHSHAGGHGHFHPHAPGWAINLVLAVLAVGSIAAAGAYFVDRGHHGWVGGLVHASTANYEEGSAAFLYHIDDSTEIVAPVDGADGHAEAGEHAEDAHGAHGTILGLDPHAVMYYISAVFGLGGILAAAWLHGPKGAWGLGLGSRTEAAHSRADALMDAMQPVARWAQHKWYVDEFYDFVIVRPLRVLAHAFHVIDKLLVDGLVNGVGALPRLIASRVRPLQSGELHGYAAGMAVGIAGLVLTVWIVLAGVSG